MFTAIIIQRTSSRHDRRKTGKTGRQNHIAESQKSPSEVGVTSPAPDFCIFHSSTIYLFIYLFIFTGVTRV
jgi:hypothetical protein